MTPPDHVQALAERIWGPGAYQLVEEAVLLLDGEILYRARSLALGESHTEALARHLERRAERGS